MTPSLQSQIYPQFFPAHWLEDAPEIVHSDFPSIIRIGYVLRVEGGYSYLTAPELRESQLTPRELHEVALDNLRALPMPGLSVGRTPGGPEAFLGETQDNFTAVRILLPVVQQALREELGDEFLVTLPCRDWMLCWSKSQAAERQAHNAADALKIFESDQYNLTPDILAWSQAGFRLHARP
jgi:uncharacterized protein YtpQ (UPF0354 family)